MKRAFILILFLSVTGFCDTTNVIFNPGFDMEPWDTGWAIECSVSTFGSASVVRDSGITPPNCARIGAHVQAMQSTEYAEIKFFQYFPKIKNCLFKTYVKYSLATPVDIIRKEHFLWIASVWVKIDVITTCGDKNIWWKGLNMGVEQSDVWVEICDTLSQDTIIGIKFTAKSYLFNPSYRVRIAFARIWVDDIHISGELVGIEEKKKYRLTISPNPFTKKIYLVSIPNFCKVRIYNVNGNLVKELENNMWDGTDNFGKKISSGVYICKIKYNEGEISQPIIFIK